MGSNLSIMHSACSKAGSVVVLGWFRRHGVSEPGEAVRLILSVCH